MQSSSSMIKKTNNATKVVHKKIRGIPINGYTY